MTILHNLTDQCGVDGHPFEPEKICQCCKEIWPLNQEFFKPDAESEAGYADICIACRLDKEKGAPILAGENAGLKRCIACFEYKQITAEFWVFTTWNKAGIKSSCRACLNASRRKGHTPVKKGRVKRFTERSVEKHAKICNGCNTLKILNTKNFYKDKSTSDGYKGRCKVCVLAYTAKKADEFVPDSCQDIPADRECICCHLTKPLTNEFFHKKLRGKNGFNSRCSICSNQLIRDGRARRAHEKAAAIASAERKKANAKKRVRKPAKKKIDASVVKLVEGVKKAA